MKLPKNFGDLTVKQYQQSSKILKDDVDQLDKWVNILACLSGKSVDFIESNTTTQIGKWFQQISFFNNPEVSESWPKRIRVGFRFYVPVINNEDLTAGQLIALNHYETREEPIQYLHEMLACIYVPMAWNGKAKTYNAKLHKQVSTDMLKVKLKDVYGFLMFKKKVLERSFSVTETYMNLAMTTIQETIEWLKTDLSKQ